MNRFEVSPVVSPEHMNGRERLTEEEAKYLAGMFEVAGTMTFRVEVRHKPRPNGNLINPSIYPIMEMNDNSKERLDTLIMRFGGSRRGQRGNSWKWTLFKTRTTQVIGDIASFSPSRRKFADLVHTYMTEELTVEDKMELALQARSNHITSLLRPTDYQSLVKDPYFVAGIVDARGSIYKHEGEEDRVKVPYDVIRPSIDVSCQRNKPLLDALQGEYGGNVDTIHLQDKEGNTTETYRWQLRQENGAFLHWIAPYSITRQAQIEAVLAA